MGIEIERKFLVDHEQWDKISKPAGNKLLQGYIVDEDHKTIRLRVSDNAGWLTFKSGKGHISRTEHEYEIPVDEATELFDRFVKNRLEKTRYCITYKDKLWEVDVFDRENAGLIVAEIELDSEDEQFELPPWIDTEVTGQIKYYNSYLSNRPFKSW